MIVLSNTQRNLIGLEGYGLKLVEQRPIPLSGDLGGDLGGDTGAGS
jgi:3,4-dihydroxy 2-butanone 4-phosphate synthase/GTP cyclohydrolase II